MFWCTAPMCWKRTLLWVGPIEVNLWAASSAMDTDFTAKLVDVREDGSTYNITEGIIRCRFREGLDRAKPLIPGCHILLSNQHGRHWYGIPKGS